MIYVLILGILQLDLRPVAAHDHERIRPPMVDRRRGLTAPTNTTSPIDHHRRRPWSPLKSSGSLIPSSGAVGINIEPVFDDDGAPPVLTTFWTL